MPRVFCPCLNVACHMARCLVVDSSKREIEDLFVPHSAISLVRSICSVALIVPISQPDIPSPLPVVSTGYEAPSRQ